MLAFYTTNSFSSRKSWIRSHILQNLSALTDRVMYLVPIDAVIVSNLLQRIGKPYKLGKKNTPAKPSYHLQSIMSRLLAAPHIIKFIKEHTVFGNILKLY